MEVLATTVRQEEDKIHSNWKEEIKFTICSGMVLNIENPNVSIKKLLEITSEFSKVAGYRLKYRNFFLFYVLIINCQK